ncbi:permease-like cell division protein FtsX [Idiomarina xiamenensis]|uniref:Cell division protein FtsX n=1 Tax=Idiomarina xiamenensis 10-D-4 TaxID=740709 RepID=K2KFM3_9GAMM|nr:permease-like cell division protein FtsX [Idiomarina xiamenensis]EKE81464.1 cell division protein FtsX [Idiomarina xiamenensis 10-D-4]
MSLLFRNRPSSASGAKKNNLSLTKRFVMFFVHNAQQAVASLGELTRNPIASLMTMAVLGLSLTLPATLYILVKNTDAVANEFQQASEITLFLRKDLSDTQIQTLLERLKLDSQLDAVRYISPEQGLADFKQRAGFGEALDYLTSNPLPPVVIATPGELFSDPTQAQRLLQNLEKQREIEFGKLDVQWLTRLQAMQRLVSDVFVGLALLLCLSALLIVGNTIRLNILSKREEIVIMKLVGATNAYIQRPFLYTGIWYGVVGGIIAWLATFLLVWWLSSSVIAITELYDGQFRLAGLSFNEMLVLWGIAIGLGLLGSYIAVRRHVLSIEPR